MKKGVKIALKIIIIIVFKREQPTNQYGNVSCFFVLSKDNMFYLWRRRIDFLFSYFFEVVIFSLSIHIVKKP